MQIAKLLREEKVLNPTAYKRREGINTPSPETADPYRWNTNTVVRILERREYTGCTVNFKTYTNSIWDKKQRKAPPRSKRFFTTPIRRSLSRKSLIRCRRSASSVIAGRKRARAACFPAWYTVPTVEQECATARPATLRNDRITSYARTTAATQGVVRRTSFGRLFWKNWCGCTCRALSPM